MMAFFSRNNRGADYLRFGNKQGCKVTAADIFLQCGAHLFADECVESIGADGIVFY